MKIEIVSEKDNPLRKRKEYWLMADHSRKETPSRHAMLPEVASKLGTKEELIILDKIFSERGTAKSRVKVLVYTDKKEVPAGKMERQERKVKMFLEKKEKAAAAPAPEETPAEVAPAEGEASPETAEPAPEHKDEAQQKDEGEKKTAEEASAEEAPAKEEPNEDAPSEEPKEESNKE